MLIFNIGQYFSHGFFKLATSKSISWARHEFIPGKFTPNTKKGILVPRNFNQSFKFDVSTTFQMLRKPTYLYVNPHHKLATYITKRETRESFKPNFSVLTNTRLR